MSAIAKIIWYIESHFRRDVSLEAMAETIGLSRFYLSRIFPLATGLTISAYVRGRRLSAAARELAAGAPDILTVALDAGYGSHEAFTRAFRDQFGITPDALRRMGTLDTIPLMEPLAMEARLTGTPLAPRIETHPAMTLAALRERQSMSGGAGIPEQWQRFSRWLGHLDGEIGGATFGIVGEMYADCDDFDYYCAVAVRPGTDLPAELVRLELPGQLYAIFTHEGHITGIRGTIASAYGEWLPRSGYRPTEEGFGLLERYGERFDPVSGTGGAEIWIAIRPA
ncbi:AraC family transcriptional regulator [Devosia enhydra]|uniref:AraC family transcriptional regulator n=1 Tax=Devosia enhydra TaxID=665118 RepID=A0A1K2HWH0_9HYPH|nr:AraC family transcriptional regulator [Devosia enhydra]SFZ83399.1 AraC family transcriptional regulator [Devosia enhydra]